MIEFTDIEFDYIYNHLSKPNNVRLSKNQYDKEFEIYKQIKEKIYNK